MCNLPVASIGTLLAAASALRVPEANGFPEGIDNAPRGYHGHRVCESPIFLKSGGALTTQPFLLCVPYKNGWSWWTKVVCATEQGRRCPEEYERITLLLDVVWWRRNDSEVEALYRNQRLPKVKLIRNPLTRVLAAWLSWVAQLAPGAYNYVEDTFEGFVRHSMARRRNCHWSPQTQHCGEDEGVHYEVLKVEERGTWGAAILKKLGLQEGAALYGGIDTTTHKQCPGHGCSANPQMLKYYTPELASLVRSYYADEIEAYGYEKDFGMWEDMISENNSTLFGAGFYARPAGRSPRGREARRDLRALDAATAGFSDDDDVNRLVAQS